MKRTIIGLLLFLVHMGSAHAYCWKNSALEKTAGSLGIDPKQFARWSNSVVDIEVRSHDQRPSAEPLDIQTYVASGFLVDYGDSPSRQYVVTTQGIAQLSLLARHLVTANVRVRPEEVEREVPFTVDFLSTKQNLALLSIPKLKNTFAISIDGPPEITEGQPTLMIPSCTGMVSVEALGQKVSGEILTTTTPLSLGSSYLTSIHLESAQRGSPVFTTKGVLIGMMSDAVTVTVGGKKHPYASIESIADFLKEVQNAEDRPDTDRFNQKQKEFWQGVLSADRQVRADSLTNYLQITDPRDYRAIFLVAQIALPLDPAYALELLNYTNQRLPNDFLVKRQIVSTLRQLHRQDEATTAEKSLKAAHRWYNDLF